MSAVPRRLMAISHRSFQSFKNPEPDSVVLEPFISESNFVQKYLNDWSYDQFWSPDPPKAQIQGESLNQAANELAQNKGNLDEKRKKFATAKNMQQRKVQQLSQRMESVENKLHEFQQKFLSASTDAL
ncbi:hypothetical protein MCOR31_009584 [Pyricularia oryzae]|uniref:Uncharacterized protein n=1 Tax=Pyricularia grisea TaxID=148305 RepID=A0ABQ8NBC4_PYRGI|nr:hypothetical protein MCOR19_010213 [Pyricularia oryzae]KAI6293447.1 hypothetical protein MCOR33_009126 [Pyricularia grisea]KAI6355078.1 hypothetical protein MCOR32_010368 [Pyricularia oryzae]KAI6359096.1 hypothetical protein MCOR31_009584 [Pyricularia oryzae]KAI6421034.1 hypothetical protein MCOR21_009434 [Pyricularia oryzae]